MGELMSILVLEWMLLGLVGLVDVDIEVLSDILNVVKLNWLPILTWLIILVIVLDIVHHVLIFIEGKVLLIAFEVSSLRSKVWVSK